MEEVNLRELLLTILKKWWILLICSVICIAAAGWWSYYMMSPVYQASTTLYVGKNTEKVGASSSDLYLGSQLINDYREIARSKLVAYAVIEELGLQHISAGAMTGKIVVSTRGDSRVIQISVADTNPQMAMDLTNKVAEVFQKKVVEIMQIENVQIIDRAELPWYPISPDKRRNMILAFIMGFGIGVGIVFLVEFLDDTIKTSDDVQKYLELPVIGTIPVFPKR